MTFPKNTHYDFAVLGLPRTRTAWFSALLTWGDAVCWHCQNLYHQPFPDGFRHGTATCYPLGVTADRIIVIHRDKQESMQSLITFLKKDDDINIPELVVDAMVKDLNSRSALHVNFDDIDARMPEILDYLGFSIPHWRIEQMLAMNIQSTDNDLRRH